MRAAFLFLIALLLAGCARSLKTVRVPAEAPSVRAAAPDTLTGVALAEIAPIEPAGVPTRPRTVARFQDTLDAPTAEMVKAKIGPETVVFTLPSRQFIFERPAWGETLHVLAKGNSPDANSDELRAEVTGTPEARELEAEIPEDSEPWHARQWNRLKTSLAWIGFFALLGFALFIASRFGPLRLPFLR